MRKLNPVLVLLAALPLLLAAGCSSSTTIWVRQSVYQPYIRLAVNPYQGRPVYLMNVVNNAQDTRLFYYRNPDRRIWYEGSPSLQSYFWYCFEKALVQKGMLVSNVDAPDRTAPALRFTMLSVTDLRFVFMVELRGGGALLFQKEYAASLPYPPEDQVVPAILERRAYAMVNGLLAGVLGDPAFQAAFFKASRR